ncbi:MAG: maleylacetoacetate isomerase, partial [Janthinobacterium sp.]
MKLYTYFRSSAAYRVRIALNLKGIDYDSIPVHLLQDGGQQLLPAYRAVNPSALVPALDDDGAILTQSLAMLEYLDETRPGVPLLPADPLERARVRALALAIACDAHPLTNLRVLKYLKNTLGLSDEAKQEWYRHWMAEGLAAVEALLAQGDPAGTGLFCHGDSPTMADCCLV